MEGLLIAELLRDLQPRLPAERLGWRFPDDRTAVLPLVPAGALLIGSRPPDPRMVLFESDEAAPRGSRPLSPFQAQLVARAAGPLVGATQLALDRVAVLHFGAEDGFAPTGPVRLVVELAGRNANLLLVDPAAGEPETIVGVERTIARANNRYREVRAGAQYVPPPPYEKLDPRTATAGELAAALAAGPLSSLGSRVDGLGPALVRALVNAAERERAEGTAGEARLALQARLLAELVRAPSAFLEAHGGGAELAPAGSEERERLLKQLRTEATKKLRTARRRVADGERAVAAEGEARELRAEADLLLAYAHLVKPGDASVTLTGFDGEPVTLTLDPSVSAAANATRRYEQAKRREGRAEHAMSIEDELIAAVREAEGELAGLERLSAAEARARVRELDASRRRGPGEATGPGRRFVDPLGFEVFVGRNSRDNDRVTFGLGRSLDVWLHAQGYRGSHVLVRAHGRQVPFETVLFAARLAAGYSEAFRSDNVAVDYALKKNVWKTKGTPPGAVNFTQQRTVVVTPARDSAAAAGG